MKRILYILFIISCQCLAQLEMANWHFGNEVFLDFNDGCPSSTGNSSLTTTESCSTISSNSGDLLFYTNGVSVYNRNNILMTNGSDLLGNLSATQGTIIIPFPNSTNLYYIFTADSEQNYILNNGEGLGLNYSIVDMNASAGLGAVIQKNIELLPNASEKLTAIRHSNGIDYWVVTHFINQFYAYPITSGGIGTPVISSVGPTIESFMNYRGALKISPDGSRMAVCHTLFSPALSGIALLYDFNTMTGEISNELTLANDLVYYGAEFSPNSEKLYLSAKESINSGLETGDTHILQFDLESSNIINSRFQITSYFSSPFVNLAGLLQVASDGKIYHSFGGPKLSVIKNPNRSGSLSGYRFKAFDLENAFTSIGLPAGIQSFYDNIIEYENLCFGDTTEFYLNTNKSISSVQWEFGDPVSGNSNTSTSLTPTHVFTGVGTYSVSANVTFASGEQQIYEILVKTVGANQLSPVVLSQCEDDNDNQINFNLLTAIDLISSSGIDISDCDISFYENENEAALGINAITNPENYISQFNGQELFVNVHYSLDCFKTTTITLEVIPTDQAPEIEITVCSSSVQNEMALIASTSIIDALIEINPNADFTIYTTNEQAVLQSNPILGSVSLPLSQENILFYRADVGDDCSSIGSIIISIEPPVALEDQELVLCSKSGGLTLEGPSDFNSYQWSTGEISQSIVVQEAGIYSLELQVTAGCSGTMNFIVNEGPLLQAEISVNDFQLNNEILIEASLSEGTILYSIDGGNTFSTSGTFSNLTPGTYIVVIADEAGCNRIVETVVVRGAPRFFTPNSDGYNDRWHVINAQNYEGMEIEIYDRFGKQMATLTNRSEGWDGVYNGKQLATNTYWYSIKYEGTVNYGYFTLIVRNL